MKTSFSGWVFTALICILGLTTLNNSCNKDDDEELQNSKCIYTTDNSSSLSLKICYQFIQISEAQANKSKDQCENPSTEGIDGEWETGATCTEDKALGTCDVPTTEQTIGVIHYYYPDYTASSAEDTCDLSGGTFKDI